MSAVAKLTTDTAIGIIARIDENPALAVIEPERFDEMFAELERQVREFEPDLRTATSRQKITALASSITRRKTAIDAAGKELNESKRAEIAAVDAVRKSIRERLDALKEEARRPLTDWERAEEARVAQRKRDMEDMREAGTIRLEDTVADLEERVASLEAMTFDPEVFGDMLEAAEDRRDQSVASLEAGIIRLMREEAERAELAQLRAEAEERRKADEARLAAERAEEERVQIARLEENRARDLERRQAEEEEAQRRRAAEAAARAVAEAEERHAAELRRIEQEREDERRAAEQAEARRLAAEREAREAADARQRDIEHRSKIMGEAKVAIMEAGKITEAKAKEIVHAIAGGTVPHVSIRF